MKIQLKSININRRCNNAIFLAAGKKAHRFVSFRVCPCVCMMNDFFIDALTETSTTWRLIFSCHFTRFTLFCSWTRDRMTTMSDLDLCCWFSFRFMFYSRHQSNFESFSLSFLFSFPHHLTIFSLYYYALLHYSGIFPQYFILVLPLLSYLTFKIRSYEEIQWIWHKMSAACELESHKNCFCSLKSNKKQKILIRSKHKTQFRTILVT